MPETCNTCHSQKAWTPATVTDHKWFPLANKHATLVCASCHKAGYAAGDTPKDCVGCHQADFDNTSNPPHTGYSTNCTTCHTDAGWIPSQFNHPWPLTGAHASASCAGCHTGSPPRYAGTPKDCASCHQADFQSSTYPGHSSFGTNCVNCHSTTAWSPALSGAHPEAKFPLTTGAHANPGIQCTDCHDPTRGPSAGGQNTDCIHCHLGAHNRPSIDGEHTGVPNYPSASTSVNFCRDCHPAGRK
jgi:hypothetical protein